MKTLTPLSEETRSVITTQEAAGHLCVNPRTLRRMAAQGRSQVQPLTIHGKLLWPVAQIKQVLGIYDDKN